MPGVPTISRDDCQSINSSLFLGSHANTKSTNSIYFEAFGSIFDARAREHSLKRWRRAWKIALIEKLNPDWRDLAGELNF